MGAVEAEAGAGAVDIGFVIVAVVVAVAAGDNDDDGADDGNLQTAPYLMTWMVTSLKKPLTTLR